jgi:hypothetical protein
MGADPVGGDMDRTEVRELMQKLLQAKIDGDTVAQEEARTGLARAAAEQAPQIRAQIRAKIGTVIANSGNDNA